MIEKQVINEEIIQKRKELRKLIKTFMKVEIMPEGIRLAEKIKLLSQEIADLENDFGK